jgi:predicted small integral membrane protein
LAQQLNELNQMREDRLFISVTYINYIILAFVFIGGFFLLLSLALIGLEFSLSSNFVLSSILSILIGLVLGITIGLDRPYQGDISVSNHPFVAALNFIQSVSMR